MINLSDYLYVTKDSRGGTTWRGREPQEDFVVGSVEVGGNPEDLNQHGYCNTQEVYRITAKRPSRFLGEYKIVEEGFNELLGLPDDTAPFWNERSVGKTRSTRKARRIVEQRLEYIESKCVGKGNLARVDSWAAAKLSEKLSPKQ